MYEFARFWFWFFAEPGRLIALVLIAGTVLLWTRARRTGRWLVSAAAGALLVVAVFPVAGSLLAALENRFPATQVPSSVDGIVVLGGSTEPGLAAARGRIALNGNAERLVEFAALARRFPDARLVFSGGRSSPDSPGPSEADAAAEIFTLLGLDITRVAFEDASTNTYENAVGARRLADPQPGEVWLLVTSARHIPRAVGCFRAVGWTVVPYPVDYTTSAAPDFWSPRGFSVTHGLDALAVAVREWSSLAVYRMLGRTDAWFPGPDARAGG